MNNTTRSRMKTSKEIFPLVVIAAMTVGIRLWIGPRTVDDAYITFRYAHNIARGVGFVYNAGEKVLGTTTPLFALILAALTPFSSNLEAVAMVINTIADVGTAVFMYMIVIRTTDRSLAALVCALLFSFSAGSIRFTAGGMETGVFVFLIVMSSWLFLGEHYLLSSVSVGLATLTRPEGLILLVAMVGIYLLRHGRFPWKMTIAAGVVLLPWIVFAIAYFGSPIPHSVIAKRAVYHFPPFVALKSLLGYLIEYTIPLSGIILPRLLKYGFYGALLLLGSIAAYSTIRRQPNFAVFWLFPVIYIGAYAIANPPVWEWYAVPLVPFSSYVVVVGSGELVGFIKERFYRTRRENLFWVTILLTSMLLAGLYQVVYILHHDPRQGRELVYADIVRRLDGGRGWAGKTIAAPEIGTLGYLLPDARIFDTQGLISPQALPFHREEEIRAEDNNVQDEWNSVGSIPAALVRDEQPDVVITLEVFARSLLGDPWFIKHYRLVLKEPSAVFGSDGVLVFQHRNDSPFRK